MRSTNGREKHCSIIIVTFNSSAYIADCLAPLAEMPDAEIIVVDNNSADHTLDIVKGNFPSIKVISLKENIGFGRAANRGAAASDGKLIFLLNPDTVPSPLAITTICKFLESRPRVGIAGAHLVDSRGQSLGSIGDNPSLRRTAIDKVLSLIPKSGHESAGLWQTTLGALSTKHKHMTQPEPVPWVSGAAMCCRRSTWSHMGGLDEKFFLYFEDIDLCLRAAKAGWEVWYLPHARVTHYSGASFGGDRRHQTEVFYASQRYFYRKYNGRLSTFLLSVAQGLYQRE